SFTIVNRFSDKLSHLKESEQKWFDQKTPAWGWKEMITLTEVNDREGFLVNGELIIVVKVDVLEVEGKFEESSPVMETIDVNGFQVLPSQVTTEKYNTFYYIASKFCPKNQFLKTTYMNVLLGLTQTMCQSPQEISMDDIADQYAALVYLTEARFQLGWLEKKLDKIKEMKEKEEACLTRLQEMEEQLQPLKQKCSALEAQIDKEKVELLAAQFLFSLMMFTEDLSF
ncbi:hypothetical protein EUTSA_v10012069mg, partial [Eutrema salsugineum]